MSRKIIVIGLIFFCITAYSFLTQKPPAPALEVKLFYLQKAKQLETEISRLQQLITTGNEKQLQQQFRVIRTTYKQAEGIIEYYFNFFAIRLNGPPIPFFEEDEPDIGQQEPAGMQVIEGLLFPVYQKQSGTQLKETIDRLLLDVKAMQETNESFAFTDEYIFDAVMEELYRVTAMGIAGFDSQAAVNGLPESEAALAGIEQILSFYKTNIIQQGPGKYEQLENLLTGAQKYIRQYNNFNAFNRMQFIRDYLNPITKQTGSYKVSQGYRDNRSPMFYSTIKKSNTLFVPGAFDVYRYLDDNTSSPEKIALGKRLFFDKQLSVDNKRSCAGCHIPSKSFTDGLTVSIALDGHSPLPRNAPTLWNAALQRRLFLDSRSPSLEDQVMQVLNNASEMHGNAQAAATYIIAQPAYRSIYDKAYANAASDNAAQNICNAIACYERTLVALNAPFDKHMQGENILNNTEIQGFNLFMGKAKCGTCHFIPLFGGAKPPRYYYSESEVIGVPEKNNAAKNKLDKDEGRFIATAVPIHKFSFKTPALRNVSLTAPYMHNGVFTTLEAVIDFYNNGGGKGLKIAPPNQTLPFDKLNLTAKEKMSIISFMKSLTDTIQANRQIPAY